MPTKREREYYMQGFQDALRSKFPRLQAGQDLYPPMVYTGGEIPSLRADVSQRRTTRPKRKLSAWNKFVKANSKKPRFRYRNGKLNLKKMAVAFRKTPAGKKKRR